MPCVLLCAAAVCKGPLPANHALKSLGIGDAAEQATCSVSDGGPFLGLDK